MTFGGILKSLKFSGLRNLHAAGDLNYESYDMSVGTELGWYQLVFNHVYSLRNWLDWRYQISEDASRMNDFFTY